MRIRNNTRTRKDRRKFILFSMPEKQHQNRGLWDVMSQYISTKQIGDIVSNDEIRDHIKEKLKQAFWSYNTFYSYTSLLAKCCIIEKLGKTKQFDNKCGGFKILRKIDNNIRHKDIKRLLAIPTWMNWFSDPTELITRKSIRKLHERVKESKNGSK